MRSKKRRSVAIRALVTCLAVAAALGLVSATHSSTPPPGLVRVSNAGVDTPLSGPMATVVEHTVKHADVRTLGRSGVATFYRLSNTAQGQCWAIGRGAGSAQTIGLITCSDVFPSAAQPLLDASVASANSQGVRVEQVQGVAADGVASVAAVADDGTVVATAVVSKNIYRLDPEALAGGTAVKIEARGADEQLLFKKNFS